MHEKDREIVWLRAQLKDALDRVMYLADRPWALPEVMQAEEVVDVPPVFADFGPEMVEGLDG